MSESRWDIVRNMVKRGEYSAARYMLQGITDPPEDAAKAARWLAQLDERTGHNVSVEVAAARARDYNGWAVFVLVLYVLLFLPGLIANRLLLDAGLYQERLAGRALPGVGTLRVMMRLGFILFFGSIAILIIVSVTRLIM